MARGSDEIIDLLVRLFCQAGNDAILTCPPTYGMYEVCAKLQGANIIRVPLIKANGFALNTTAILAEENKSIKLIFLCSPNNPTGNLLDKNDILQICRTLCEKSIIVVDEAYIDFSEQESLGCLVSEYENLVILRTLSKAFGLAGARIGCAIANETICQWLLKIIAPYPLSCVTNDFVNSILSDESLLGINRQLNITKAERERISTRLKKIPCIEYVWQSHANYILVKTKNETQIMTECIANGIILRSMFDKPGLEDCIRISIGLPEENELMLKTLEMVAV